MGGEGMCVVEWMRGWVGEWLNDWVGWWLEEEM